MPNWCENYLTISGPCQEIVRAIDQFTANDADEEDLLFDRFEGWVESRSADRASFGFMSRWVPPVWLIRDVSTAFPSLQFEYRWWEPGSVLRGRVTICNGVVEGTGHDDFLTPPRPPEPDTEPNTEPGTGPDRQFVRVVMLRSEGDLIEGHGYTLPRDLADSLIASGPAEKAFLWELEMFGSREDAKHPRSQSVDWRKEGF